MDGVVVKTLYGGGDRFDFRCRLSVLSPVDLSACVNLSLPSYLDDKYIKCGSCCGLFSFDDEEGNIVLCNLTTKEQKPLPPPPKVRRLELFASGIGYDSKSDDFKVIRFLGHPCFKGSHFDGYKLWCELYSLKSGVWKDIPMPDADLVLFRRNGVYIGGRCYWTAYLGFSFGGPSSRHGDDILSFDLTTESFHVLHLPPSSETENIQFHVIEHRGSLGVIGFSPSNDSRTEFRFEFWVREECSWCKG